MRVFLWERVIFIGCQMNIYDTAIMHYALTESEDIIRVAAPEEAYTLLPNTCSIREKVQEKIFHN